MTADEKNILLLEPGYKNKYPPLGLMKISYYHKYIKKDNVKFAKGKLLTEEAKSKRWDRVYITSLFTFEWKKTIKAIEYGKSIVKDKDKVFVGGILATLMPKEIEEETGMKPIKNRLTKDNQEAKRRIGYEDHVIDNLPPDYSIIDDIDYEYPSNNAYFAYMTRGCGRNCEFCAVDELEPEYVPFIDIKEQIKEINEKFGEKKNLLLMDNNVLRSPRFDEIVKQIKELGFEKGAKYKYKNDKGEIAIEKRYVDFNQGLDANFLTEKKAKKLSELAIKPARIAFDHIEDKDKYKKAIKRCAKYGIKYFSNYILYNSDSFGGKGNKYKADKPEDLYKRLKITMDLQDEINKGKEGKEKIKIYSFPMKYIPLKDKDRSYIGPKWNKKFLRAIQVMLLPSHGIGGVSDEFFRKAFGEDLEEYKQNLRMPESILMSRGKFLKRDDESEEEWEQRVKADEEAWESREYYREWEKLYKNIEDKSAFLNQIQNNKFKFDNYFKIDEPEIKTIYLHYLSNSQFLFLLNELTKYNLKKDIGLIYDYVVEEFDLYINKVAKYICNIATPYRKLVGYINIFGEFGLELIFKYWINSDFENDHVLDRLQVAMFHIGQEIINIDKLRAIKCYIDSGCLNETDIESAKTYIKNLNEKGITKILKVNFNKFKNHLKAQNKDEPAFGQIEKRIEILTAKLGEQLSLF